MSTFYNVLGNIGKASLQQLSKRNAPQLSGKIQLKGIQQKVEIIRDTWGIPHIYAKNRKDLSFAQGYVHAQDRFWQMEIGRRAAYGTLSEIFGEEVLEVDIASRTFGFARLAKQDLGLLNTEVRTLLAAYTKGINAFLATHIKSVSVEFSLIQQQPKRWTVLDTLAFSRLMTFQLSHGWQHQLLRTKLIEAVGPAAANELEVHYDPSNPAILEDGIDVSGFRLKENAVVRGASHPLLMQNGGSNSWSIAPNKTTTGRPLLANDPHLRLGAPAIWYENHLHAPDFHVTGVTIPAFPLVLIGHNEHISWGITLAFMDCEDLFAEKFKPDNPNYYEYKGKWEKVNIVEEDIWIKGEEEPYELQVKSTRHGVIVSEVAGYSNQQIALQSNALQAGRSFQSWYQLNQAKNWKDFVHALSFMDAPQLNIIYADVNDNIGYWVTGKVPIRAKGQGRVVVPGWTGEYEWVGTVPFMEMPHALNPQKDYVITANNKIIKEDYPHYLGDVWMNGYRANRLETLMQQKEVISPLACQQMQMDIHCIPGKAFADLYQPLAAALEDHFTNYEKALFLLANWDGELRADRVEGSLYTLVRQFLMENLLKNDLSTELMDAFQGVGVHKIMGPVNEFKGHESFTLLRLLNDPNSIWIKRSGGRKKLLTDALNHAVHWLTDRLGTDLQDWTWGSIHHAMFAHIMGERAALAKVFNIGPIPISGDADTPFQTSPMFNNIPNKQLISASYRQVLDVGNWENCKAVMPPGQSGHISSRHYQSQLELWLKGDLRPMLWSRAQVEVYSEDRLVLSRKEG